jgi:transcriptional regulator with XRE-family HTH domain
MTQFPQTLKAWRNARWLSQLDLAAEAGVSARHISFLENGRAHPSREMVGKLCDALRLPLVVQNQLFTDAGFAPLYLAREWNVEDMAPIRAAIAHTLQGHSPYPGFVIDRFWTVLEMNSPSQRLFGAIGITVGTSLIDLIMADRLQPFIENWSEVARHSAQRLRVESAAQGGIHEFDLAAAKLAKVPHAKEQIMKAVVPTVYRVGAVRLSLFATIAQFGTPEDLALDDLKLELFFPADVETKAFFDALE